MCDVCKSKVGVERKRERGINRVRNRETEVKTVSERDRRKSTSFSFKGFL